MVPWHTQKNFWLGFGQYGALSDKIKILGATLDANLTLAPHIKALSSSCFYHIRSFRQIRSSSDAWSPWTSWTLFCMAFHLSTQLAFNESSVQWLGLSCTSNIAHLQFNELLKQLHWLAIEWRIRFKLATLTFKALHIGRPPYLSDLLHYHEPMRSLRSSSSHQLSVPRQNLSFGSRAFRFSAPRVWNPLPVSIRESHSLPTFRRNLKTFYFQSAYPTSAAHLA